MTSTTIKLLARPNVGTDFMVIWSDTVEVGAEHVLITPSMVGVTGNDELVIEVSDASGSINFAVAHVASGWRTGAFAASHQGCRVVVPRGAILCLSRNGLSPLTGIPQPEPEEA